MTTFQEKMKAAQEFMGDKEGVTGTEYHCFCEREKMIKAGWEVSRLFKIDEDWFVFSFVRP
jgi:hypothetical protein